MLLQNFLSKSSFPSWFRTNGLTLLPFFEKNHFYLRSKGPSLHPQVRFLRVKASKKKPELKMPSQGVATSEAVPVWGLDNMLKRKKLSKVKKPKPSSKGLTPVVNKLPKRKVLTVYAPKPIPQRRENRVGDDLTELVPIYFKELKKLPVYLVKSKQQLDKAMNLLLSTFSNNRNKKPYIGFDTEHPNGGKVAIIQFANDQIALVIQLRHVIENNSRELPPMLKDFLENKNILKVGVNSTGDAVSLERAYGIKCKGIKNIEELAREEGLERQRLGLKRLSIECRIGMGVLKGPTTRKLWNAPILLKSEILYAVKDAIASYRIFSRLTNNPGSNKRVL